MNFRNSCSASSSLNSSRYASPRVLTLMRSVAFCLFLSSLFLHPEKIRETSNIKKNKSAFFIAFYTASNLRNKKNLPVLWMLYEHYVWSKLLLHLNSTGIPFFISINLNGPFLFPLASNCTKPVTPLYFASARDF